MSYKVLQSFTLGKAADVNNNFYYLKDKQFTIPYYEFTTGLNSSSWQITASFSQIGTIAINDICDVVDKATGQIVISGGVQVVGKVTDSISNIITFYKQTDLTTPVTISQDLRITFPIYSTFEKLPADVFRREFIDAYQVNITTIEENLSSLCDGNTYVFTLQYTPINASIVINKNYSLTLLDGVSNDFTINYSTKQITLAEAPILGDTLIIRYITTAAVV